jgi:hypothetical protein
MMGIKDLVPGTGGYELARQRYGFSIEKYGSLEQAAENAAGRIYSAGISYSNGQIAPGHNNVMADFAAAAFAKEQIETLLNSGDQKKIAFAEVIRLRQEYIKTEKLETLGKICERVTELKKFGFRPDEPPRLSGPRPV